MAPQALGGALYREAQEIIAQALPITPIRFGPLRRSAQVHEPEYSGATVSVTLGFGNDAVKYAVYVHENLTARHMPPTQAKFLEIPLNDAVDGMADRLAASAGKALGL